MRTATRPASFQLSLGYSFSFPRLRSPFLKFEALICFILRRPISTRPLTQPRWHHKLLLSMPVRTRFHPCLEGWASAAKLRAVGNTGDLCMLSESLEVMLVCIIALSILSCADLFLSTYPFLCRLIARIYSPARRSILLLLFHLRSLPNLSICVHELYAILTIS